MSADSAGNFVVVWAHTQGRDGAGFGLFGRRFNALGVTGQTLITGAVGTGCTGCDAASIEAYLQTMS